ncbi:MAG: type VI secretion system Vgr family protein [Planctomycetota bacterium]
MARTQRHRVMAVGTPLGADVLLLQSFSITEQLGRPFTMSLDLVSEDHAVDFDAIVGQNVTVRLETTHGGTRYFNGLVSSFAQHRRIGRLAQYEATVVPTLWLLTKTSDCRIFQNQKVPDIIKEVMKDHGLTDIEDRLTGTYREWDYCVQYRESDFNFVSRLMEQEGIYYCFKHENGKHTLVLCDAPSAHKPFPGYETVSYRPPDQATTDIEHVHDWAIGKHLHSGAFALNDFDFENPRKILHTQRKIIRPHLGADFEMFDHPGEYTEFSDGEQYARLRMEELAAQHEVARGASDVRGIAAGSKFTLTDYPRQDQNREYLVVSSSVTGQADAYDSAGNPTGRGPLCLCSFSAIPAGEQYRAPRLTPKPVVEGCQTAIVVGPKGEEIHTDKYGRVKVQFHWDRRSEADETSSCWIRVTQNWAGKKWGAIHVPRIGQEVIVDFLEGDPDRPIITGTVYNGAEMPPYKLPKEKTRSGTKTNSSKGGGGYNEFSMDDTKGKEQIRVHAEKDKDERVKNDSREWIGRDRHLIIKRHQHEKIEENKNLHVVGDHSEKIEGKRSLEVDQDEGVKIGMSASKEVGMSYYLKAGMNLVIEAGLNLTLKGPGGSIAITPAGIFIAGSPFTYINSGSGAVSGRSIAVKTPEDPDEAKKDVKGEVDKAPKKPKPPKPATYSAQAKVLKRAAKSGTPFCEECAAAAAAKAAGGAGPSGPAPAGGQSKGAKAKGAGPSGYPGKAKGTTGGGEWKSQQVKGTGPSGYPGKTKGTTGPKGKHAK